MKAPNSAKYANVLEAQIKSIAAAIGVSLPPTAFSNKYSADVPITIPVRLALGCRINSTSNAGEKPQGQIVTGSSEANIYLAAVAREKVEADALALNVRSVASSTKQVLSSETASVKLATLTEQASTVQACGSCRGGEVACSKCKGSGEFGCGSCDGRGKVSKQCSNCGGHGKLKCHSCHGSGNVTNHYQVLSSDGTRYNHEMRYERCSSCGGSGFDHYACAPCSGSGKVFEKCSRCSGSGKVSCSTCSGNGSLTCQSCQGHARTTTIYQVEPYVTTTRGQLRVAIQEVEDFIVGNLKLLTQDPHFAPSLVKFSGTKSSFDAEYHCTVAVGGVAVTAAGKTFKVYAIGPSLTWTTRPAFADALLSDLLAKLKATRSAHLSDIPALVGNSEMAKSLVQGSLARNAKFTGKLLPGLSREMADGLQAEVTRLYKSAQRARLTRRALIAAPFAFAGAGALAWQHKIWNDFAAERQAELERRWAENARKLEVWKKAAASRQIRTIKAHSDQEWVKALAYSPDGRFLLSGGSRETDKQSNLRLWDVASGSEVGRFRGLPKRINEVSFSRDGTRVLVASEAVDKGSLTLWDFSSGRQLIEFIGHKSETKSAKLSRDGRFVLSVHDKEEVRVWDAATGQTIRAFHPHDVASRFLFTPLNTVAISPDGKRGITGGGWVGMHTPSPPQHTLRLWDLAAGREINNFDDCSDAVQAVHFSLNGRFVLAGGNPSKHEGLSPTLFDVATGKVVRRFAHTTSADLSRALLALNLSPDGRLVAAADESSITVWAFETGVELTRFHAETIHSISFASNGRSAATGDSNGSIKIWDLKDL